ncbi:hypothetical protein OHA91_39645 (plasmid) [Streptomyces erythrochromogenes]|uniref:Integral membrane protein n=1 Tax=Streptomyces erythrochromogenes TaxID=285574 RepID=A0ABZ1QPC6_9ACTN|nr:hypothetical protein [Streptomyces erythrochromogenes]
MSTDTGLKARRARLILAAIVVAVAGLLVAGGFAAATLMRDDAKGAPQAGASPSASSPAPTGGTATDAPMTPERAQKISLRKPTDHKDGVAIGFPGSPSGGISAAVYWWEEFAWLDDEKAAQQLNAVVSKDAPGYVDKQVSEIRKMREVLGLAPSGGIPADVSFTTAVHAARGKTLKAPGLPVGDVMQVWLSYDRFATGPKGGTDPNPMRGATISFVVKWEDGAWKFTDKYDVLGDFPVAYEPNSPYAWSDGWVQVRHAN